MVGFSHMESQDANIIFSTDRNGVAKSALNLNGGFTSKQSGVYFNSAFTISAWVYPKQIGLSARLIDFGNGEGVDSVIFGLSKFFDYKPYLSFYNPFIEVQSSVALKSNEWSFLAANFNGTHANIYINGNITCVAEFQFCMPNDVRRSNNYIGKSNWAADGYSFSLIDDLRIYNRYLSYTELMNLMNS